MSQLLVDDIVNKDDTGAPGLSKGVIVTGVTTTTSVTATQSIISGVSTFAGLTTVTSTDAFHTKQLNISGIASVGTAVTIYGSTGIVSATSFYGDGSNLTGVDSTALKDSNDAVRVQANTSGAVVTGITTSQNGIDVTGGPYTCAVNVVAALDIDMSSGSYFTKTITTGTNTFTFSNPPPSGTVGAFTLELKHDGGSPAWPASVKWPGGNDPNLTDNKTHLFMFITDDNGARYRGAVLADYTN